MAVLSAFVLFSLSCRKDKIKNPSDPAHLELSSQGKILVAASNDFAFSIFRETGKTASSDDNIMISPLSISYTLGMALNGARTSTADSIKHTLGFGQLTMHDINLNYKLLVPFLVNADHSTTISLANSIWYRNEFQPLKQFLDTCSYYFDAQISQVDFNNPSSLNTINNWVAAKTNNKITKLLSQLKPDDVMYLINAVYFKGKWTIPFKPSETQQATFYKTSGQKQIPMMNGNATYKYFYHNDFSMLELDYGCTNYAMNILLPHQDKDLDDIQDKLDASSFNQWIQQLNSIDNMIVQIPKFRFEYEKSLDEILTAMGMGIAFSDFADFTGISTDIPLLITEVKHKTFVEVNEEGTEAAAATSVGIGVTSMPPSFIANRPFIFMIRERDTNTILFIGKVGDPSW